MEWFTRKRPYGWPPHEVIEKCQKLGFLVVPVGHPSSQEKDKEWRISLSLQERLLVTLLNSVQLKCFVLMKVLKNDVINNKLGKKILTSYHCKTCMLYMVESMPSSFWEPTDLLKCIPSCLEKLLELAEKKNCPNYFIPKENMFDKLESKDLELLANTLQTLLSENFANVLLSLGTGKVAARLCTFVQIYKFLLQDNTLLLGNSIDQGDYQRCHALDTIYSWFMRKSYQKKLRDAIVCQKYFMAGLSKLRSVALIYTYDRDLTNVVGNLKSIVDKFESETMVTEHSEEETQMAISLFLPFIKHEIASFLQKHRTGNPEKEILEVLTGMKWHESYLPIDSSQLKIHAFCMSYDIIKTH